MSIQKELDNVRKKNLDNQILDIFDKLNKQCQDLTGGMDLEQLLEEVEQIEFLESREGVEDEFDYLSSIDHEYCDGCSESRTACTCH
jgi:hypothetical protein